ncbi:MAG: helix-turn-helix transcriptional regulator [Proteobacteria bacterium]|nr:helix-turn-helix transcriptional regulator [Pseudomonadota bacterium]
MPLLQNGQDPEGLSARVAYHLHRLGITAYNLDEMELDRYTARRIREGSLSLGATDVVQLASALQLDAHDLSRPLSDEEKSEWTFYRVSARHATEVWRRVVEASTANNVSQRRLAEILGISQSTISRTMRGERKSPVLSWRQASNIAVAFNLEDGAEAFISPYLAKKSERDRG